MSLFIQDAIPPWVYPRGDVTSEDVDLIHAFKLPIINESLVSLQRYAINHEYERNIYMFYHKDHGLALNTQVQQASTPGAAQLITAYEAANELFVKYRFNVSGLESAPGGTPSTFKIGLTFLSSRASALVRLWSNRATADIGIFENDIVPLLLTSTVAGGELSFTIRYTTSTTAITKVIYGNSADNSVANNQYPSANPSNLTDVEQARLENDLSSEQVGRLVELKAYAAAPETTQALSSQVLELETDLETERARVTALNTTVSGQATSITAAQTALSGFLTGQTENDYENVSAKITSTATALDTKYGYSATDGSFQNQINTIDNLVGDTNAASASTGLTAYDTGSTVIGNIKGVIGKTGINAGNISTNTTNITTNATGISTLETTLGTSDDAQATALYAYDVSKSVVQNLKGQALALDELGEPGDTEAATPFATGASLVSTTKKLSTTLTNVTETVTANTGHIADLEYNRSRFQGGLVYGRIAVRSLLSITPTNVWTSTLTNDYDSAHDVYILQLLSKYSDIRVSFWYLKPTAGVTSWTLEMSTDKSAETPAYVSIGGSHTGDLMILLYKSTANTWNLATVDLNAAYTAITGLTYYTTVDTVNDIIYLKLDGLGVGGDIDLKSHNATVNDPSVDMGFRYDLTNTLYLYAPTITATYAQNQPQPTPIRTPRSLTLQTVTNPNFDATNHRIVNLGSPEGGSDAVTKTYVDTAAFSHQTGSLRNRLLLKTGGKPTGSTEANNIYFSRPISWSNISVATEYRAGQYEIGLGAPYNQYAVVAFWLLIPSVTTESWGLQVSYNKTALPPRTQWSTVAATHTGHMLLMLYKPQNSGWDIGVCTLNAGGTEVTGCNLQSFEVDGSNDSFIFKFYSNVSDGTLDFRSTESTDVDIRMNTAYVNNPSIDLGFDVDGINLPFLYAPDIITEQNKTLALPLPQPYPIVVPRTLTKNPEDGGVWDGQNLQLKRIATVADNNADAASGDVVNRGFLDNRMNVYRKRFNDTHFPTGNNHDRYITLFANLRARMRYAPTGLLLSMDFRLENYANTVLSLNDDNETVVGNVWMAPSGLAVTRSGASEASNPIQMSGTYNSSFGGQDPDSTKLNNTRLYTYYPAVVCNMTLHDNGEVGTSNVDDARIWILPELHFTFLKIPDTTGTNLDDAFTRFNEYTMIMTQGIVQRRRIRVSNGPPITWKYGYYFQAICESNTPL